MTLPAAVPGVSGYVLSSDTSGVTSWVAATSSSSGITLGTSAGATNPQRSGQIGTGLFSASSNSVSIADAGADVMDVAATGPNILGTITQGSYSVGYEINGNNAVWQDVTNKNLALGATGFPATANPDGGNDATYNLAVGYHALNVNTTGAFNAALGQLTLALNTTGQQNTAVGGTALAANTVGNDNTALGYSALNANITGINNAAVGDSALFKNTSGQNGTAIGYKALYTNVTGSNNTTLGYQAGYDVNGGSHNVIIGDYTTTGVGISTGNNNILIGQDLQELTAGSSNQLDIGNLIFATGLASGTTMSTGSVGIGTATPAVSLDLSQKADAIALPSGSSGQRPSAMNGLIRYNQSTQVIEGYYDGAWNQLGNGSGTLVIDLGTSASATNPQRNGDVGTGLFSPATGAVSVASGGSETERFTGGVAIGTSYVGTSPPSNGAIIQGNVGIGTATPTSLLHVVDSAAKTATYIGNEFAISDTSRTASDNKTGDDIQSTGTWNGTSAVNIGLNVNATGGTTNYAALFNGGNVGIGTATPGGTLSVVSANATGTTTSSAISLTANALTSGTGMDISSTSLTSGKLVRIAPTFAGSGATGYGLYIDGSDSTGSGNTDYGVYSQVLTTSTTGDTEYGLYGYAKSSRSGDVTSGSDVAVGVFGKSRF